MYLTHKYAILQMMHLKDLHGLHKPLLRRNSRHGEEGHQAMVFDAFIPNR